MISPDNGDPADYAFNGKHSTLTQQLAGRQITQIFVSEDGRRENRFTLSEDGKNLSLKVTLTSDKLTRPVVYVLSYKRAS
jgi:hypothetical protein